MCGRYRITDETGVLRDVFPSEEVLVLTAEGEISMVWGFTQAGTSKRLLINARAESAGEKATFSALLAGQRCLIPAASFYEWDREKKPHTFGAANHHHFYMAGLYRAEQDGKKHFVILTKAADATVSPVHPRMPCMILSAEYAHIWLHNDALAPDLLKIDSEPCSLEE